jgi:uncharacterized MnhB-related membrane protein
MMAEAWVFDALLAVILPLLAGAVMVVRDLFRAVVLFIVFGLLLSLAWVRLQAPDIALAEAAIGAGLTGVLFLNALGRMRAEEERRDADEPDRQGASHDR